MLDGLELLSSEVPEVFRPTETDEDVHGALERRLVELVGVELGGRPRAGRSRNDQIATLIRMHLRDALRAVTSAPRWLQHRTTRRVIILVLLCQAAPTCSTLSRCCSRTNCWHTAGRCCGTAIESVILIAGLRSVRTALPLWPAHPWD